MKTIEEAAIDCANIYLQGYRDSYPADENDFVDVFESGVEFAQRWIPADEKPDTTKLDGVNIFHSEWLLLKVKGFNHYFMGYYAKTNDDDFFDIYPEVSGIVNQEDITHYRYIDLK